MNTGPKPPTTAALALLACLAIGPALAATARDGRTLYNEGVPGKAAACATCHGPDAEGTANGTFPRIAGLPAAYVVRQLEAFKSGKRANAIMAPIASALDTDQMQAMGAYLSDLKPAHPAPPQADEATLRLGQTLVTAGRPDKNVMACIDCHGPRLMGGGPDIPPLSGQWQSYLAAQLQAFKSGGRPGGPQDLMSTVARGLSDADIQAAATYIASLREGDEPAIPRDPKSTWKATPQQPDSFTPPPESAMPTTGDYGKALLLGEQIFDNTPRYAGKYVGNAQSCRNCHLQRGRDAHSAPLWAAVPQYPKYRGKNKRVNDLTMRIQGCFTYSENGTPPPADSDEMVALITYAHWMASGLPMGIKPKAAGYPKIPEPKLEPSKARGAKLYAEHCAMCHNDDGSGRVVAGDRVFPALWGKDSFNWGAGMHRVNTAAYFIKANMPFGIGGSLTDQQAWDVARYITSHSRPQDPRYKGDAEQTYKQFHANHKYGSYLEVQQAESGGGD